MPNFEIRLKKLQFWEILIINIISLSKLVLDFLHISELRVYIYMKNCAFIKQLRKIPKKSKTLLRLNEYLRPISSPNRIKPVLAKFLAEQATHHSHIKSPLCKDLGYEISCPATTGKVRIRTPKFGNDKSKVFFSHSNSTHTPFSLNLNLLRSYSTFICWNSSWFERFININFDHIFRCVSGHPWDF